MQIYLVKTDHQIRGVVIKADYNQRVKTRGAWCGFTQILFGAKLHHVVCPWKHYVGDSIINRGVTTMVYLHRLGH